jgi:hypothetical protein
MWQVDENAMHVFLAGNFWLLMGIASGESPIWWCLPQELATLKELATFKRLVTLKALTTLV